jgi:hypothetical protein
VTKGDLRKRLPELSITMAGTVFINITKQGVDKGYGLEMAARREWQAARVDGIYRRRDIPGGNNYLAKELGITPSKWRLSEVPSPTSAFESVRLERTSRLAREHVQTESRE